jgi:hypothetical protein
MDGGVTEMGTSGRLIGIRIHHPEAMPSGTSDHQHIDRENGGHQDQRDHGLGKHHMNPRITAPQNRKARAATTRASFSKDM